MKPFGIVYLIVDTVNGKMYVGQTTKTLKWRFNQHARCKKTLISQAIHEHKRKKFTRHVLKECKSKVELNAWEMFFIAALKTKAPLGYNCTDGGEGTAGCIFTPESRAKNSLNHLGEKNSFFGKHHTLETRLEISIAHRGNSPYKNLLRELDEISRNVTKPSSSRFSTNRSNTCWLATTPEKNLSPTFETLGIFRVCRIHCATASGVDLAKLLTLSQASIYQKMSGKYEFTARDSFTKR